MRREHKIGATWGWFVQFCLHHLIWSLNALQLTIKACDPRFQTDVGLGPTSNNTFWISGNTNAHFGKDPEMCQHCATREQGKRHQQNTQRNPFLISCLFSVQHSPQTPLLQTETSSQAPAIDLATARASLCPFPTALCKGVKPSPWQSSSARAPSRSCLSHTEAPKFINPPLNSMARKNMQTVSYTEIVRLTPRKPANNDDMMTMTTTLHQLYWRHSRGTSLKHGHSLLPHAGP